MATYKVTNVNAPIESDYWIDYPIKDPATNLDSVDEEGRILVERHVTRSVNAASYKSILAKMPAVDANTIGLAKLKTYAETNVQALNTALNGANTSITSVTKKATDTATTVSNIQQKLDTMQGINIDEFKLVTETNIRANATNISTNKADISTIKADIVKNNATIKADISTNKADISTNKADISTNKADISTIKADISTIKADTVKNNATIKADISTIKADTVKNNATIKADISTIKADIVTNNTNAVHITGNESISGVKTFTNTTKMNTLSVSNAIYKETTNGFLVLKNGTGETGAYALLYGSDHATSPGCFDISARTDSGTISKLVGRPNGSLTWNNKEISTKEYVDAKELSTKAYVDTEKAKYLLLAGGSMTGSIRYNGSNMYFHLRGGEDEGSAYLNLYNNLNGGNGQFSLSARNSTITRSLVGNPNGELTWNGSRVMTVGVGTTVTGVNNFSNGLKINGHSVTIG